MCRIDSWKYAHTDTVGANETHEYMYMTWRDVKSNDSIIPFII